MFSMMGLIRASHVGIKKPQKKQQDGGSQGFPGYGNMGQYVWGMAIWGFASLLEHAGWMQGAPRPYRDTVWTPLGSGVDDMYIKAHLEFLGNS